LILAAKLLGLAQTEFQKSFEIVIQLGAIGAVVLLYWRQFLVPGVLARVLVAFLPTGAIGLAFYRLAKTYLLGNESVVLLALFLGGVILIAFEVLHREPERAVADVKSITYLQAIVIGFFQAVAIIPGVSRSGATIVGGLAMGLNRETIVEFSFLLAVPTMIAATGLDLVKNASWFSAGQSGALAVGFIVAMLSIKFLLAYVRTRTFIAFGVYRIIAAALFYFLCWSADRVAIATLVKTPTGRRKYGTERLEHPRHARNSYSGLQGGTVPVAVRGRRFVSAFQKIHEEATRIVGDTDLVVRQDKFTQSFVVVGLSRANHN
jgi:undecaprenyl-diphosphatase